MSTPRATWRDTTDRATALLLWHTATGRSTLPWVRRLSSSSGQVSACCEADHREGLRNDQAVRAHQARSRARCSAVSSAVSGHDALMYALARAPWPARCTWTTPASSRGLGRRRCCDGDGHRHPLGQVTRAQRAADQEARRCPAVALEDGRAGGRVARGDRAPDFLSRLRLVRDRPRCC